VILFWIAHRSSFTTQYFWSTRFKPPETPFSYVRYLGFDFFLPKGGKQEYIWNMLTRASLALGEAYGNFEPPYPAMWMANLSVVRWHVHHVCVCVCVVKLSSSGKGTAHNQKYLVWGRKMFETSYVNCWDVVCCFVLFYLLFSRGLKYWIMPLWHK
jgi:hypothetical protein